MKGARKMIVSNNYCWCPDKTGSPYCSTSRTIDCVTSHLKPRNSRPVSDCRYFDDSRNTSSLTGILTAIEVIDRVPGDWWRDGAIAFYSSLSGVERRHVDRIREIQASIAGGAA